MGTNHHCCVSSRTHLRRRRCRCWIRDLHGRRSDLAKRSAARAHYVRVLGEEFGSQRHRRGLRCGPHDVADRFAADLLGEHPGCGEPLDRWRRVMEQSGYRRERGESRQGLDHLRQHRDEPFLRPLLCRVGRQRQRKSDLHEQFHRRWRDLVNAGEHCRKRQRTRS